MEGAGFAMGFAGDHGDFLGQGSVGMPAAEGAFHPAARDGAFGLKAAVLVVFTSKTVGDPVGEVLLDLEDAVGVPAFRNPVQDPFLHFGAAANGTGVVALKHEAGEGVGFSLGEQPAVASLEFLEQGLARWGS